MNKSYTRALHTDEIHAWDNLLDNSPQSTVFHKSMWLETCGRLSNRKSLIIGYFKDDILTAGCPLFIKDSKIHKVAYSSERLTPYGGFVLRHIESTKVRENEKISSAVFSSICGKIAELKLDYMNIVNSPALQDIRPFIKRGWHPSLYYTYILPLHGDTEKKISKNARRAIRKAEKEGITIKKQYDKELYWSLNVDTYKRQGTIPPFSQEYLSGLLEAIIKNNMGEMWVARTSSGEPASAEVVLWDSNMPYRWSAASNAKFLDTGAASLLMFRVILNLKEKGFKQVNLMGANISNISSFISSFNPNLVPYFGIVKWSRKYKFASQFLNMKRTIFK